MTARLPRAAILIAPYAVWIALMTLAPATARWYAVRGAVTAALLAWGVWSWGVPRPRIPGVRAALAGVLAGLGVFVLWIAPETWFGLGAGAAVAAAASPYAPSVCGWTLTLAKLGASAFVIPAAEELFFRRWLVDFAGFWWMVALFAVEHGERWAVGAAAGVAYGLLARRFGLGAAIVAHSVTNLALGLWVIGRGAWQFW